MQTLAFQREVGDIGKEHVQGYVVMNTASRPARVCSLLQVPWAQKKSRRGGVGFQVSFRAAKGSHEQNISYTTCMAYCRSCHKGVGMHKVVPAAVAAFCSKCECGQATSKGQLADTTVFEGNIPSDRSIRDIVGLSQGANSMRELARTAPELVSRHFRFVQFCFAEFAPMRAKPPVVVWLSGGTGTGKSKFAASLAASNLTYWVWSLDWFDGLRPDHQVVIFDDIRPSKNLTHSLLLRLADRYPMKLAVKGASTSLIAPVLVFTSPFCSTSFWSQLNEAHSVHEDVGQLTRRITHEVDLSVGEVDLKKIRRRTQRHMVEMSQAMPVKDDGFDPRTSNLSESDDEPVPSMFMNR